MKPDLKQKIFLKNMIYFSEKFYNYEPFIFYGSLLGIVREKNVIKNDDDIDFFINYDQKDKILNKISNIEKFKINHSLSDKFFTQIYFFDQGIKICIDMYFYLNPFGKNYIIDKHNFFGDIKNDKKFLHIPKKLIFPLIKCKDFDNILIPNLSNDLCEFLYGNNWKTPLRKNVRYKMSIKNNKPILIKINFLSGLVRSLKIIIKNIFKKY